MTCLKGSCICGSVTFEAKGKMRDVIGCHCVQCRKFSGHYTAATSTRPENITIHNDNDLAWFRAEGNAERGFCRQCGSSLLWKPDSSDRVSIYVGCLDGDSGLEMTSHIFVDEKGDYYELNDGLDTHQTFGAKLELE
jgi:hypothetical protein